MELRTQDTQDMQAATPGVVGDTVVGLFAEQPAAERGIAALKAAGFSEQQIGVAIRDKQQQKELAEGTGTQAAEGAAAGGLIGALVGMGVPEEDAQHFERGFQQGKVLITVQAGPDADEAREVLLASGGDLGPTRNDVSRTPISTSEAWRANERRFNEGASYGGPERRLATR